MKRQLAGIVAPITLYAPEPYDALRPIPVLIVSAEDGFEASFFDANMHASGDTEEEALRNLKTFIFDVFDSLEAEPPGNLGPKPSRQLAVLREFVARKGGHTQSG